MLGSSGAGIFWSGFIGGTPFSQRLKTLIVPQSPTATHHWPSRLHEKWRKAKALYFGVSTILCALMERKGSDIPLSRTTSFTFFCFIFVLPEPALMAEEAVEAELPSRTCRGRPSGTSFPALSLLSPVLDSPVPEFSRR